MVPAVPAGGSDNGRRRVPAGVPDNRLPCPSTAVVIVPIGVALVGSWAGVHRSGLHVYLCTRGAVEIPYVHTAVVRARVDVSLVCGGSGREVAANEGFENAVAAESYEGAVVRVRGVVEDIVWSEAIIEVCGVVLCVLLAGVSLVKAAKHLPVGLPSHRHPSRPSYASPTAYMSGPLHC